MRTQALKQLIDDQRRESFRPECQSTISDAKALGVLIARYFEWDGAQIMETAASALEDANFSREAAQLQAMPVAVT